MEAWAGCWYAANPSAHEILKNVDVAYVLAFGIIMLNTDLHNDQVQKKMTIDDFVKNMKGINDGGNVEREFLNQYLVQLKQSKLESNTILQAGKLVMKKQSSRQLMHGIASSDGSAVLQKRLLQHPLVADNNLQCEPALLSEKCFV